MSNLSKDSETLICQSQCGDIKRPASAFIALPGRQSTLGTGLTISRVLPNAKLRMVGPWCFLDHIGPVTFSPTDMIDVAPHPHIGLQTATWMIDGELLHKDSLGYTQVIRPGQLNLMTAGHGISHSEESPEGRSPNVHGVQFWIALPKQKKDIAAEFEHFPQLPMRQYSRSFFTLFIGEHDGMESPATAHSPILGAEIVSPDADAFALPLETSFEYALMVIAGEAELDIDGETNALVPNSLYYLGGSRDQLMLKTKDNTRVMLIGGESFAEPVSLWWNFVGHSNEDIHQAKQDWENNDRFGEVKAYTKGTRLSAPELAPTTRMR